VAPTRRYLKAFADAADCEAAAAQQAAVSDEAGAAEGLERRQQQVLSSIVMRGEAELVEETAQLVRTALRVSSSITSINPPPPPPTLPHLK
jgi:hypothetical protein